jgi:hypothetical protein
MHSRALAVAAIVGLVVPGLAGTGHARPREGTAAVLALEISGDGEPMLRQQLLRSLTGGLAAGGLRVVDHDAVRAALTETPELAGCTSTTCLSRIGVRVGATYFVRAQVEASGSSYTIALELLSAEVEGALVMRLEDSCSVCTIMELNDRVSGLARKLVELPPAQPTPVVIDAQPRGARLVIDGRDVGVAPYRGQLSPGEHAVAATLGGWTPADKTIVVSADASREPQTFELTLAPLAAVSSAPEGDRQGTPGRRYRPWKWAAAGGAAAALIGGISLLALDGNGACDRPAGQTQCPELYDTWAAGVLGVLTGLGLGATSGWLFYADARAAAGADVALTPTPGGAFASLELRF